MESVKYENLLRMLERIEGFGNILVPEDLEDYQFSLIDIADPDAAATNFREKQKRMRKKLEFADKVCAEIFQKFSKKQDIENVVEYLSLHNDDLYIRRPAVPGIQKLRNWLQQFYWRESY